MRQLVISSCEALVVVIVIVVVVIVIVAARAIRANVGVVSGVINCVVSGAAVSSRPALLATLSCL